MSWSPCSSEPGSALLVSALQSNPCAALFEAISTQSEVTALLLRRDLPLGTINMCDVAIVGIVQPACLSTRQLCVGIT